MSTRRLPRTDSIRELADFWDTHDVTDFGDQLVEVTEQAFDRATSIAVPLQSEEMEAVQQIAQAKGVTEVELIREWVKQKLSRRKGRNATRRPSTTPPDRPRKK